MEKVTLKRNNNRRMNRKNIEVVLSYKCENGNGNESKARHK